MLPFPPPTHQQAAMLAALTIEAQSRDLSTMHLVCGYCIIFGRYRVNPEIGLIEGFSSQTQVDFKTPVHVDFQHDPGTFCGYLLGYSREKKGIKASLALCPERTYEMLPDIRAGKLGLSPGHWAGWRDYFPPERGCYAYSCFPVDHIGITPFPAGGKKTMLTLIQEAVV